MFYTQCNDCNKRWELGTASTCKCPDFWEGYIPEPVKPAQQEPVAWVGLDLDGMAEAFHRIIEEHHSKTNPFSDPVNRDAMIALRELRGLIAYMKRNTSPPAQRTWVGLTVEKILHLVDTYVGAPSMSYPLDSSDWINFARAIEAAHNIKEKNT